MEGDGMRELPAETPAGGLATWRSRPRGDAPAGSGALPGADDRSASLQKPASAEAAAPAVAQDEPMAPPAATSSSGARSGAPAAEGKTTPEAVGPAPVGASGRVSGLRAIRDGNGGVKRNKQFVGYGQCNVATDTSADLKFRFVNAPLKSPQSG